jgi:ribosome recycling factor
METAKVSIRNARRDVIEQVKKMVKDGLPEDMSKDAEAIAQKMTDEYGKKADEYFAKKEKDIMTI